MEEVEEEEELNDGGGQTLDGTLEPPSPSREHFVIVLFKCHSSVFVVVFPNGPKHSRGAAGTWRPAD